MGKEVAQYDTNGKAFGAFSLATVDSYLDEAGNFQQKETIWHDVLAFSPSVLAQLKTLKKGSRIELIGSLSYRPFTTTLENGSVVEKKEAMVIAHKVSLKPLYKKQPA